MHKLIISDSKLIDMDLKKRIHNKSPMYATVHVNDCVQCMCDTFHSVSLLI